MLPLLFFLGAKAHWQPQRASSEVLWALRASLRSRPVLLFGAGARSSAGELLTERSATCEARVLRCKGSPDADRSCELCRTVALPADRVIKARVRKVLAPDFLLSMAAFLLMPCLSLFSSCYRYLAWLHARASLPAPALVDALFRLCYCRLSSLTSRPLLKPPSTKNENRFGCCRCPSWVLRRWHTIGILKSLSCGEAGDAFVVAQRKRTPNPPRGAKMLGRLLCSPYIER